MLLAQGRYWRATAAKDGRRVVIALTREGLAAGPPELRDPAIEVPIARWNSVLRHALSDRKLLGGVLLDLARHKEHVAGVVVTDRLLTELQRVVLEATAALVEADLAAVVPPVEEVP
jgi:hypothetical protein